MRILALLLPLLVGSGCLLRSTLPPKVGDTRVVLWDGTEVESVGGAETYLDPRTEARVAKVDGSTCEVDVSGPAQVRGKTPCSKLGAVAVRPARVYVKPDGPVRLVVNGGVLLALKERKEGWIRVAGDALRTFEGWMKVQDVGIKREKSWLAPGLPRYPWRCSDGSWVYDRPGGTFLLWIPSAWCRVERLQQEKGWTQVRYVGDRIRVEGWIESGDIEPDREPRFHPGARVATVQTDADVFATPQVGKPFGKLVKGVRVWASLDDRGRTLVQTYATPVEVIGWVPSPTLGGKQAAPGAQAPPAEKPPAAKEPPAKQPAPTGKEAPPRKPAPTGKKAPAQEPPPAAKEAPAREPQVK